ncbi:MAG: hypothetical protein BAJALOKI3v1_60087 [Promethearchaeota archaeon]|nr:MAG: hypothetical protein BAJALOKI3v1_60087 [Candidatus Lokiarchaeota archaeon]
MLIKFLVSGCSKGIYYNKIKIKSLTTTIYIHIYKSIIKINETKK